MAYVVDRIVICDAVRDRVSGVPRGDGLDPSGEHNLYDAFEVVPPEYRDEFHPNVVVRNWQGVPLEGKRDDWIPEEVAEEGRFVPAAVLRAMRRRAQQDPNATIRPMLGGWRDLVVINDEAHHVYGKKRTRKDDFEESWQSSSPCFGHHFDIFSSGAS